MDNVKEKTACFSGRREIAVAEVPRLESELFNLVKQLAERGYNCFICGGALGFDTLAATAVIHNKREFKIKLVIAVPHKGQEVTWSEHHRKRYAHILTNADEVVYIAEKYTHGCMQARNRFMVDNAGLLVAYSDSATGGTAYTCAYAIRQGVERLYM